MANPVHPTGRRWALGQLVRVLGGSLEMKSANPSLIAGVSVDSRTCASGDIYFALRGARVDGHDFLVGAAEAGAGVLVCGVTGWSRQDKTVRETLERCDCSVIVVQNPLGALQQWASQWLSQQRPGLVISVTGSAGKTTAKEMLLAVARKWKGEARVYGSRGNYNSVIGLPLSVLGMGGHVDVAIFEAGISEPGEMEVLGRLLTSDGVLFTSLGTAHIANFGSKTGIAAEKFKLIEHMAPHGVAVIPQGIEILDQLLEALDCTVLRFPWGTSMSRPIGQGLSQECLIQLDGAELSVALGTIGWHNCSNAQGVATMMNHWGCPLDAIVQGLQEVQPVSGRMELIRSSVLVIKDSYNANPEAVRAALGTLGQVPADRKHVVLADMLELGTASEQSHRSLAQDLSSGGYRSIVLCGEQMRHTVDELTRHYAMDLGDGLFHCDSADQALQVVRSRVQPGDAVLVKGSRSMGMEVVADGIVDGS